MPNPLSRIFPIVAWLPGYTWVDLRGDLVGGLTIGIMLIPQAMAYAMLAGLPPMYGLYASLVPLVVYPLFGTSRHLAIGTVAIDMVIIAVGLSVLAEPGSERYIELAILLALMVGGIQVLMGVARLGFVVNLLSKPIIVGFTSAAALIIAFSQLGNLLGVSLPQSQQVLVVLWGAVRQVGQVQPFSVVLGVGGVVLLIGLSRWKRLIPGPLVAVVVGTLAVWWLGMHRQGVAIVGTIPTGLPGLHLSDIDGPTVRALLPTALTLVLVQFLSVVSLGKVFAARYHYSIRPNRELVAIGAANFLGSFFKSIPVSGSFSRTAVNAQAGGRTPVTNVIAALLIGLTLIFLTPLFYYLPIAVLAAIIMLSAFGLLDVREVRYLLRTKRIDGGLAILTFLATFFLGIQEGILVGVVASVVAIMYRISRPHVAVLGHLPATRSFADVARNPDAMPLEGIVMLRVDASFSFVNAELVKDAILEKSQAQKASIHAVIIDASTMNDLDMTAVAMLTSVAETLHGRGIALYFGGVRGAVYDVMVRSGLYDVLGEDHFFLSPHRAVKHVLREEGVLQAYLATVPGEPEPAE
ncbi:MAG: SulP family inorganic anion transporter [Rhodothermales bacterium]